jgi:hypothetical protein
MIEIKHGFLYRCNQKFIEISSMLSMVTKDRYDRNTLKFLKKDFWKEFI